jgi:hypothetical protein
VRIVDDGSGSAACSRPLTPYGIVNNVAVLLPISGALEQTCSSWICRRDYSCSDSCQFCEGADLRRRSLGTFTRDVTATRERSAEMQKGRRVEYARFVTNRAYSIVIRNHESHDPNLDPIHPLILLLMMVLGTLQDTSGKFSGIEIA